MKKISSKEKAIKKVEGVIKQIDKFVAVHGNVDLVRPFMEDPRDQANLDLHFVEAFIDLLNELTTDTGTLDTLKTSTVGAMCYESRQKIESLKKFIESVQVSTEDAKAA
jgi:hypothetical protein